MSIQYRCTDTSIIIFGNTFPHKERIKAIGGRFNAASKSWFLPYSEGNLSAIDELCASIGGGRSPATLSHEKPNPESQDPDSFHPGHPQTEKLTPHLASKRAPKFTSKFALEKNPSINTSSGSAFDIPSSYTSTDEGDGGLSIRQVMDMANYALSRAFPDRIWVVGELQNVAVRSNAIFFDLAEPSKTGHHNATLAIRCVVWKSSLDYLKAKHGADIIKDLFQDGLKFRCLCQLNLYKDRGQITLLIDDIDPAYTQGGLALARQQLLKELRAKGLDQKNKQLTLPAFPFHVGLISAEGSRAQSDFLDQLMSGSFPGQVSFCATPMQGESVPQGVSAAIRTLAPICDVIVITRGGGSAADLRWFDAKEIALAVAHCQKPVIAAIGHHDDTCVTEEIAFLRQKTPTAAADFILHCFQNSKDQINNFARHIARLLGQKSDAATQKYLSLSEILHQRAQQLIQLKKVKADNLFNSALMSSEHHVIKAGAALTQVTLQLDQSGDRYLITTDQKLQKLLHLVSKADPKPWLKQGWTQLYRQQQLMSSVKDLNKHDIVEARLLDGKAVLRVEKTVVTDKEK